MQTFKFKIKEIDRFLLSTIEKLENQKMTLMGWLLTFLTIVFLRNFFETFSSEDNLFLGSNWGVFFGQYVGFFLCWLLVIILFIYFLTRENIEKISKLALLGVVLALVVSIVETAISFLGGEAIRNKYGLIPNSTTFFGLLKLLSEYAGWGIGSFFMSDTFASTKTLISVVILRTAYLLIIIFFAKKILLKTKSIFLLVFYTIFVWAPFIFAELYFYSKAVGSPSYFSSSHFFENIGPNIIGSFCAIACALYVLFKTKSIIKTFVASIFFYFLGFFVSCFPYIFAVLFKLPPSSQSFYGGSNINPKFEWNSILTSIYLILIFCLSNLWFFIYSKEKFLAIWKNLRPFRLLHNLALLGFGLYIAIFLTSEPYGVGVLPGSINFFDCLLIIMAILSVFFFWLSAIGYDDVCDEKIDKISNSKRPLCQNRFNKEEFKMLSNVFRGVSYFFSAFVGFGFFLLMFLRSLMVYIYSSPPFRLKRFPLIATFLLSLSALFTVLAGFVLSPQYTVLDFPKKIILFILTVFTFGFMAKDIKDYEGDRADNVYTIPVIFGERKGKIIIGALTAIALFCPVIFFPAFWRILILPSIFVGTMSFLLINRKNYSEKFLFLVYFFYGVFFVLTCFRT